MALMPLKVVKRTHLTHDQANAHVKIGRCAEIDLIARLYICQ